jgi:hypothetical protein
MGPESPAFDLELNGATVASPSVPENTFTFAGYPLEDNFKMEIIYCV